MELDTSAWMMIFFLIALVVSVWKIYAFLPNKELHDDDTTKESKDELMSLVLKSIRENHGNLNIDGLLIKIEEDEDFDNQRYWRFNKNKLKQLLNQYYLENPTTRTIEDIYDNIKA